MCGNTPNVCDLKFALKYNSSEAFTGSKVVPVPILAAWRLSVGVYCFVWLILNLVWFPNGTFFIFLTHLAFTASTTFFLIGAALSVVQWVQQYRNLSQEQSSQPILMHERQGDEQRNQDKDKDKDLQDIDALAWHHKAFWAIYYIAANVSLAITLFYWTYFNFTENTEDSGLNDMTKHLFTTIFLLFETAISGIPVFVSHVIYPFIFTGCYMTFTIIFWLLEGVNHKGNKQIYDGVEYGTTPAKFVVLFAFLFACAQLIMQLILFAIYKLRHRVLEKSDI